MSTSIITYTPPESNIDIDLRADYDSGSVWATQKQIAQALELSISTVSEHLTNFKKQRGEMVDRHIRKFRITADDGKTYDVEHYDVTAIAYVGFRAQATERIIQFQDWVGLILDKHLHPKQLTNLDALEYVVAELRANDTRLKTLEAQNAELYQAQGQLALTVETVVERLDDKDWLTVLQFCQKQGIKTTISVRIMWGKKASEISRERGVAIGNDIEGQYSVHKYHKDILLEVCVPKPKTVLGQLPLPEDE